MLRDDFSLVEIILGEQDDSQEIFNSLNAHGKPLTQSDLLRSFIFMRAEKSSEDRDALFSKYWSIFEDRFWDIQIRRGNLLSSRLDHLTRIFLSVKVGATVDARKVHLTYKGWIEQNQPYESVEAELSEFAAYGRRYRLMVEPLGDDFPADFARRLLIWDVSTALPLVLFLFEEAKLAQSALSKCFSAIESYIVRRLICQKDNKEYNKSFVELVSELRRLGPSPETLISLLSSGAGSTREWPTDTEFARNWCDSEVYRTLQSSQIILLLKSIDDSLRNNKSEKVLVNEATIEHVMPQEWAANYPLNGHLVPPKMAERWYFQFDDADKDYWDSIRHEVLERNRRIHSIGNLTLVTKPLNSSMKNGPFLQKKEALRNSVLVLNRYFDSIDQWNESDIEQRSRDLLKIAVTLWQSPAPPN